MTRIDSFWALNRKLHNYSHNYEDVDNKNYEIIISFVSVNHYLLAGR